jgi:hypothetical protein
MTLRLFIQAAPGGFIPAFDKKAAPRDLKDVNLKGGEEDGQGGR